MPVPDRVLQRADADAKSGPGVECRAGESIRRGRVVAVGRDFARIEFDSERCERCDGLCGLRGQSAPVLDFPGPTDLQVGSDVRVALSRGRLRATSVGLFGGPLLVLFAGPMVLRILAPGASEVSLALTGVVGCVAAVAIALRVVTRTALVPRLVGGSKTGDVER